MNVVTAALLGVGIAWSLLLVGAWGFHLWDMWTGRYRRRRHR